ncbi:hypothetical protein LSH36_90g07058 [Paralvinella palmiformis]|uniref:5-hydroxyisourate hydrolase n=1 Tax=Paralvinella palmiformis TaxID=53620 RepID=A0AAD9K182_9ANNE|nr:hypothetical protein LSH36_90g07058 [Paralvinella palmiformis]
MAQGSPLTTHILDTARGCPARNVPISLYRRQNDGWHLLANGATNNDGRCPGLLTQQQFTQGTYKLYFDTGAYYNMLDEKGFFPYVEVVFVINEPNQHYHVPLLLSPYSYSTYRGS